MALSELQDDGKLGEKVAAKMTTRRTVDDQLPSAPVLQSYQYSVPTVGCQARMTPNLV